MFFSEKIPQSLRDLWRDFQDDEKMAHHEDDQMISMCIMDTAIDLVTYPEGRELLAENAHKFGPLRKTAIINAFKDHPRKEIDSIIDLSSTNEKLRAYSIEYVITKKIRSILTIGVNSLVDESALVRTLGADALFEVLHKLMVSLETWMPDIENDDSQAVRSVLTDSKDVFPASSYPRMMAWLSGEGEE